MKAADIPDASFLAIVREYNERGDWAMVRDLAQRLNYPVPVIEAKARKLIRRGLMDGCTCGCRGDYSVPGTPLWWPLDAPHGQCVG